MVQEEQALENVQLQPHNTTHRNVDNRNFGIPALEDYRDLLSTKDLSELLGVSKQTAYKEIRSGKFGEPLKFGREYRIPKVYIIERYFRGHQA